MINKKTLIIDYAKIIFLALLMAISYELFVVPNNFAPAGINGVAVMVQYKLHFSIGFFSLIVNLPLCVFAYFKIDKDFGAKSFVFCLVYALSYLLFQNVIPSSVQYDAQGTDTVFPCLIAGMISGFIYGMCFRTNASTGGTDIVAKYVSKKKPVLNFFWITFIINACVASVSLFVYATPGEEALINYKPVCLCVLYCFLSSFIGNYILKGYKLAYRFTIVTEEADKIEEEIIKVLKHSATRIKGEGAFSKKEKDVLICIVNKHQLVTFKRILMKYPKTFVTVDPISETVGNFKKIHS